VQISVPEPLTPNLGPAVPDRASLLSDLRSSADAFLGAFAALSSEQLAFHPGPGRWSVAETVEHVALAEVGSGKLLRGRLVREPAPEELLAGTVGADERLVTRMGDRTRSIAAPDFVSPSGTWPDAGAAGAAFRESRNATIDFLTATELDLARYAAPHPVLGPLTGLQWAHFLVRHCLRHREQIVEIPRAPGYPAV
jgi:uncharacterized damage-inducible protein DinB